MIWWHIVLVVIVSYCVGNISISRILAGTKKKDITKLGSGNAGSTNVLRNFGLGMGVLNLVLDILKGFIPAFVAYKIFNDSLVYLYIAGISVMIGHIYPVIFKFKGGKGIASMLGVFLASNPIVTLIVIAVALISWLAFKYGSIASFICVTALTFIEGLNAKSLAFPENLIVSILLFVIFCLTWYAHRGNIVRLLCGKESKVSLIKSTKKRIKENIKDQNKLIEETNEAENSSIENSNVKKA